MALLMAPAEWGAQQAPGGVSNPPISAEVLVGSRGVAFQMITNKKLQSVPRLGFFSVVDIVGEWENAHTGGYMGIGKLSYTVVKNLDGVVGFHTTDATGFRPSVGVVYSYAHPSMLLVLAPRADLKKDGYAEMMALIEYKPNTHDSLNFYARVQGLYVQTLDMKEHGRSYIITRLGLRHKDLKFGVGANWDWYGPQKKEKINVGAFLSATLF